MNQSLSRLRDTGERGAAMFLIIMTILIVVVAGAFAVDLSATSKRGQDLQNAADSAALAGVQAYRASIASRETELVPEPTPIPADEAAAKAAVEAMLAQNGLTGLTPVVTFPDAVTNAEVRVEVVDPNGAGRLFSGFTSGGSSVGRSATARFERCQSTCTQDVEIPPPFLDINTRGDGDGYKPIPVGDRLFAINHNSGRQWNGSTRGNRQMTCVDRFTSEPCWGANELGKNAYPGTGIGDWVPDATPEMPHAAVYDEMIYWVSSTQAGTYLFCFNAGETVFGYVDQPCAVPYLLNDREHASVNLVEDGRQRHRGGGAFEWKGQIFAFTDDHRIHCIEPGVPLTPCENYGSAGLETQLGQVGFPTNEPADGNHGSSIDRIIDLDANKVYATLHVNNPAPTTAPVCSALTDPTGEQVVIKNKDTGRFIAVETPRRHEFASSTYAYELQLLAEGSHLFARWYVDDAGGSSYFIRSAANTEHIDADNDLAWAGTHRQVTPSQIEDERWEFVGASGDAVHIQTAFGTTHELVDYNGDIAEAPLSWSGGGNDEWEFYPYECFVPDVVWAQAPPTIPYESGTYLHCWDLASAVSCSGFTPQRIHDDSDVFSGRLFFHRTDRTPGLQDEVVQGICSTGFTTRWRFIDMSAETELACFDHKTGVAAPVLAAPMTAFFNDLQATNTGPSWGTWGDPHWNKHTNRVFYPTNRRSSRVLCWDFDSGSCGYKVGYSATEGAVQDYGFYSDGNCIFGLGHEAVFWAFSASDMDEKCSGSGRTTTISPCSCAGELTWGTLKFDIDKASFGSFLLVLRNEEGAQVFPPVVDGQPPEPHSVLAPDGDVIDLSDLEITGIDQELTVQVTVEPIPGVDPWANGASQTFRIELERTPRLTD